MNASYGTTSGFAPVNGQEMTAVNGGIAPAIGLALAAAAAATAASCANPMGATEANRTARFGAASEPGCSRGGGGGGK